MRNAGLEEAQAGIKIAGRNINNLKYADDTTYGRKWRGTHKTGVGCHCLLCGATDWFQIGKGVRQGYILSPCLFNLYAEYIMQNTGLDESQAGIKTARRNINDLRYADDTTFMAKSKEELKSLLMKVKEESEQVGL